MGLERYSIGVDIWALGCIFAELFLHRPLFDKEDNKHMLWEIFRVLGTPDFDAWSRHFASPELLDVFPRMEPEGLGFLRDSHDDFDACAEDLLTRMLAVDPCERPSCRQILQHPFLARA